MGDYRDDNGCCCYFHPREMVIGVCALCLHERLTAVASNQKSHNTLCSLKKVFALTRYVDRMEINFKQRNKSADACSSSLCSPDDSFISIKFEANGVALWDKDKIPKRPLNPQCDDFRNGDKENKVKNIKKRVLRLLKQCGMPRWRRRIGRLFNVFRWKKSKKENRCKKTKVEGSRARFGWMTRLGKRITN